MKRGMVGVEFLDRLGVFNNQGGYLARKNPFFISKEAPSTERCIISYTYRSSIELCFTRLIAFNKVEI